MKYCCKRFEDEVKRDFIEVLPDSTINAGVCDHCFGVCIKFCPFCGTYLGPKYTIQNLVGSLLPWVVYKENKPMARFESEREAHLLCDRYSRSQL